MKEALEKKTFKKKSANETCAFTKAK